MKYIRTKTGYIFDKNNLDTTFKGSTEEYYFWKKYLRAEYLNKHHFLKDKILKEADNIEELCDEFVLYDDETKYYGILGKGFYHRINKECKKTMHLADRYIYGAIWTCKGLIYVSKINEKGEMELL